MTPTLHDVIQGLMDHAAADTTILAPVLSAYSVSLPLSAGSEEATEKLGFIFGEIEGDYPDGWSLQFIPEETFQDPALYWRQWYRATVIGHYQDGPNAKLSDTPRAYRRFALKAGEALQQLFRPASLGATAGGWSVSGAFLLRPWCDLVGANLLQERSGIVGVEVELEFSGFVMDFNP